MSLNIKLVFKEEIHRLTSLPTSYSQLQNYCSSIFKHPSYTIKYLDEENDEITIGCDSDLQTAYASAESTKAKSLRLHLSLCEEKKTPFESFHSKTSEVQPPPFYSSKSEIKEETEENVIWERHTCDGCGKKPIVGPRFHCAAGEDFDFCSECEKTKEHEHPLMKFVKKNDDQYVNFDINPDNLLDSFIKIKDFLFSQRPKCKVLKQLKFSDLASGDFELRWLVKNVGNCKWPANCRIQAVKGNISACFDDVPQLNIGEEGEIVGKTFVDAGKVFGKWKIVTCQGLKVGKLKVKATVCNDLEEKVRRMVEMGFSENISRDALKANGGDLEKTILSLSFF